MSFVHTRASSSTPGHWQAAPSRWIRRFTASLPVGTTVLDVACGGGRHLRWLAARGCVVTGIDRDLRGVADLAHQPGITLIAADLEQDLPWPLPTTARFAAVLVTNYLHRPLFPHLLAAVQPGGLLLYETFALGNGRFGRPSSPEFLLHNGELLQLGAGTLQIIAYEHGRVAHPKPAIVQRLAAIKDVRPVDDLAGDPEPYPLRDEPLSDVSP